MTTDRWFSEGLMILGVGVFSLTQGGTHPPHSHENSRKIEFPDIPGYKTLKTDFHQHTALSDGNAWPPIRIEEAVRDGLDVNFVMENMSGFALHGNADLLQFAPHSTTEIKVMTLNALTTFDLKFRVWNAVTAPGKHPEFTMKVDII